MRSISLLPAIAIAVLALALRAGASDAPRPDEIRKAVNRAIPLLQQSLAEYPRHTTCFSCHHQGVGIFALATARSRGFNIDETGMLADARHTDADLRAALDGYRKGQGQPGGVTRAGYALFALQAFGAKPDELTGAVSGYLLKSSQDKGFWHAGSHRPPAEASDFTDTFLSIRALKNFGEAANKEAAVARIERARQWLEQAEPKDTEDRVFQLWGLKEAGSENAVVQRATQALLAEQREDGGWAQLPGAASDAYATSTVLSVLLQVGGISADDAACRRAVSYLLQNQQADGSWHVVTRSKPVQPYFESGFPHGKDQFISVAATGWATAALALALPQSVQR